MSAELEEELDATDRLIVVFRAALEALTPELAREDVDKVEIVLSLGVAMCGCAVDRGVPDEKARRVVLAALREAARAWEKLAEYKAAGEKKGEKKVH